MQKIVALVGGLVLAAGTAGASSITFQLDGGGFGSGHSTVSNTEPGSQSTLSTTLAVDTGSYTLLDGQSRTLDFFTATTKDTSYGRDVDLATINATLVFKTPVLGSSADTGTATYSHAGSVNTFGINWGDGNLQTFTYLHGGVTDVISVLFNNGVWEQEGCGGHWLVTATITNDAAPSNPNSNASPVPEPGTMMLLGTGLLGLAGYGRRGMKK